MPADKVGRIERALAALESHEGDCALCPRACRVDRRRGPSGVCRSGTQAVVSTALLHFGEEPVLSGTGDCRASGRAAGPPGSGTIFFAVVTSIAFSAKTFRSAGRDGGAKPGTKSWPG